MNTPTTEIFAKLSTIPVVGGIAFSIGINACDPAKSQNADLIRQFVVIL